MIKLIIELHEEDYKWIQDHGYVPDEYLEDIGEAILKAKKVEKVEKKC